MRHLFDNEFVIMDVSMRVSNDFTPRFIHAKVSLNLLSDINRTIKVMINIYHKNSNPQYYTAE